MNLFLFTCALLLGQSSAAQNVPPAAVDPNMIEQVNRLANVQKNLAKNNTPGAELWAREISRLKTAEGTLVQYEFFASNLPKDLEYRFGTLRINQELQMDSKPKTLDFMGRLIDGPDDPLYLFAMAAKGEPYRFQLASPDGKYRAFLSLVPFPILDPIKIVPSRRYFFCLTLKPSFCRAKASNLSLRFRWILTPKVKNTAERSRQTLREPIRF